MDRPTQDPFAMFAINLGESDELMFEQMFDVLYKRGLDTATPQEMALTLGVAVGTIGRLRRKIRNLEDEHNGR